jgi:hypothetical protein
MTPPSRGRAPYAPAQNLASVEAEFERELEVFRTEAEGAAQFFYAYLAIHAAAGAKKPVYRLLNTAPLFWNTILGGLQTSAFVTLGRGLPPLAALRQQPPQHIHRQISAVAPPGVRA